MKLYPFTITDQSPNALRSTFNPDRAFIGKTPQRGNSGNHPEIISGWCGTTNDSCVTALGEFDTDEEGWETDLVAALPDDATVDFDALKKWIDAEQDEDDLENKDFEITIDTAQGSPAFTWDESGEDNYYPETRDGWTLLANYDQEDDVDCLDKTERDLIETLTGEGAAPMAVGEILDAAGIHYDLQNHETYNSGTNGTDWAVIAVRDDDTDEAVRAIRMAVALADSDLDLTWAKVAKMLAVAFEVANEPAK